MTADLSVVIVSWNTRDLLAACLRSVGACAHGRAVETFVVDNASADGSAAMVREAFPHVRLIENSENVGFARANNQAIRQARGRYVMLLNSDAVVQEGALGHLVRFMDGHPDAGAAGPFLENEDGSLQPSCHPVQTPGRELWRLMFLDRLLPRATYPMGRWSPTEVRQVEIIKGACLLLRRAALDQVGLLDEQYFMYSEEMDLCYRLSRAGWALYWVPQAHVTHFGGESTRQLAELMYLELYRSKVQFQRKFWGKRGGRQLKIDLLLAYLARLFATTAVVAVRPSLVNRLRVFWRLVAELPRL